ncbi:MAG: hypothetical protein Kow0069_11440 [Promethearchaeota archaeon]
MPANANDQGGVAASLKFKVVVCGDRDVGKTSLIKRFCEGTFDLNMKPTLGVDFGRKDMTLEGHDCAFTLWDFAGEEKFRVLLPGYISGASGALLVFDLAAPTTFESLPEWLELLRVHGRDLNVALVANKLDLLVDEAELEGVEQEAAATRFLDHEFGPPDVPGFPRTPRILMGRYEIDQFVVTSAKENYGVEAAFERLGNTIIRRSLTRCAHCGRLVPKQVLFCFYCGNQVVPAADS